MNKRWMITLLLAASMPGLAQVREGQWEYDTTVKPEGQSTMSEEDRREMEQAQAQMKEAMKQLPPGMKLPGGFGGVNMGGDGSISFKTQKCVTREDLAPPAQREAGLKCDTQQQVSGNSVTFKSHCTGKKTDLTSEGSASYTGDTMVAKVNTRGTADGVPLQNSVETRGRYLGACPAATSAR